MEFIPVNAVTFETNRNPANSDDSEFRRMEPTTIRQYFVDSGEDA